MRPLSSKDQKRDLRPGEVSGIGSLDNYFAIRTTI